MTRKLEVYLFYVIVNKKQAENYIFCAVFQRFMALLLLLILKQLILRDSFFVDSLHAINKVRNYFASIIFLKIHE